MSNECRNVSQWRFKSLFDYEDIKYVMEYAGMDIINAQYNDVSTQEDDAEHQDYWLELEFESSYTMPVDLLQSMAAFFDCKIKAVAWEFGNDYFHMEDIQLGMHASDYDIALLVEERTEQRINTIHDAKFWDKNMTAENFIGFGKTVENSIENEIPPMLTMPPPGVHDAFIVGIDKDLHIEFEIKETEINGITKMPASIIPKPVPIPKINGDRQLILERIEFLKKQQSHWKSVKKEKRGNNLHEIQSQINLLKSWLN